MELASDSGRRLAFLDQWRGISVLLVIIHHFVRFRFNSVFTRPLVMSESLQHPTLNGLAGVALKLTYIWSAAVGHLGVDAFFVISGFIITHLLLREEQKNGRITIGGFYARRAFRIMPPLVLFVCGAATLSALGAIVVTPTNIATAAVFLCNTSAGDCGPYFGHLWSLSVEEQFYLAWPLIFLFAPHRYRIAVIIMALSVSLGCSLVQSFLVRDWLNNGLSFACICAGVLFALSSRLRNALHRLARFRMISAIVLLGLLPFVEGIKPALVPILNIVMVPLLVISILVPMQSRASPALVWVGRVSYSLYLWHAIFTWNPEMYLSNTFALLALPLGIIMALASAKIIEPFFIELGRSYFTEHHIAVMTKSSR